MKWKVFFSALTITVIIIGISCSKNQRNDLQTNDRELKAMEITFTDLAANQNSSERMLPPSYDDGGGGCSCRDHGGTMAFSISWILATCRSDCNKGIGFRCGREGALLCRDGAVIICVAGANCPGGNNSRLMKADLTFYDDNTIKFTFLNAVPPEEASNTVFEVEQTEFVNLPPGMKLDGVHYSGFSAQAGNYTINYSDGPYGSVIINAQLQL